MKKPTQYKLRSLWVGFLLLTAGIVVYATDAGPSSGSTFGTSAWGGATQNWSNTTNVGSSDNSYASVSVDDGDSSNYITVTNFGFAIPASSTIEGIEVSIECKGSSSKIKDGSIKLIQNGVISGNDNAVTPTWGNSDETHTYGSSETDLWGLTWTGTDINSANFGVAISVRKSSNGGGFKNAYIDQVTLTVHYSSALPVEYASFTSSSVGNKIKLEWATATEKDNDFFTVERSQNGSSFTKVTIVDGAGTTNNLRSYSAFDENPVFGTSYYRLNQTDFNGQHHYSDLISVSVNVSASPKRCKFKIHPNPCVGQCSIQITDCDNENVSVSLLDALGNEVYAKVPVRGEEQSFTLDASNNLKPGVYIVMGSADAKSFSDKVVVQ